MSYDGEYQTSIIETCSDTPRDFEEQEKHPHGNSYPRKIFSKKVEEGTNHPWVTRPISTLECEGHDCQSKSFYTNLNDDLGNILSNDNGYFVPSAGKGFTGDGPLRDKDEKLYREERCNAGDFVGGIQCDGSRCHWKKLYCLKIKAGAGVVVVLNDEELIYSQKTEESTYSTHKGKCMTNYYLIGIRCYGNYCPIMKLICRKIEVRKIDLTFHFLVYAVSSPHQLYPIVCTTIYICNNITIRFQSK